MRTCTHYARQQALELKAAHQRDPNVKIPKLLELDKDDNLVHIIEPAHPRQRRGSLHRARVHRVTRAAGRAREPDLQAKPRTDLERGAEFHQGSRALHDRCPGPVARRSRSSTGALQAEDREPSREEILVYAPDDGDAEDGVGRGKAPEGSRKSWPAAPAAKPSEELAYVPRRCEGVTGRSCSGRLALSGGAYTVQPGAARRSQERQPGGAVRARPSPPRGHCSAATPSSDSSSATGKPGIGCRRTAPRPASRWRSSTATITQVVPLPPEVAEDRRRARHGERPRDHLRRARKGAEIKEPRAPPPAQHFALYNLPPSVLPRLPHCTKHRRAAWISSTSLPTN